MRKRILAFALVLTMALVIAACGNNDDNGAQGDHASGLEPVELLIYFLGDGAPDNDEVFELINERTSELINTTMRPMMISWADFATRYPLVFASGEYFDIIFTASWSFYADQAVRGGFYNLTMDMLEAYAPNIVDRMPAEAFQQARIGGNVYMVPNNQAGFNHAGIMIRGDLRRAHGIPEITSVDLFVDYLLAITDEPGIIPLDAGSDFDAWAVFEIFLNQPQGWFSRPVPFYVFRMDDPTGQVFNMSDTQAYRDFLTLTRELNQAGVWRMDALTNPNSTVDNFMAGRSGSALHNMHTLSLAWQEAMEHFPEWEPELIDGTFGTPTVRGSFLGNGFGIRAISQHPERSLMWLEAMRSDRELYDLIMYGIEGRHWIDEGNNQRSLGPDNANFGGFSNWAFTCDAMRRRATDEWPGQQAHDASMNARAIPSPAMHFLFDDVDLANEMAAMSNLSTTYDGMLLFGFDADWEATVARLNQQYDSLGRQEIVEEYMRQLREFLAD